MFNYEKRLEYPIHIKETNPKLAKAIITQYGGLYCKKLQYTENAVNIKVFG